MKQRKRTRLVESLPELYSEIDRKQTLEKNPGLNIEQLGVWSQEQVVWTCNKHQVPYSWQTQVGYRSRGGDPRPCPECRRQQQSVSKEARCDPIRLQLVKSEYASTNKKSFDSLSLYSMLKLDWKCIKCGTRTWQARLSSRLLRNNNCPDCFDRTSVYEKRMRTTLQTLGIPYKPQHLIGCNNFRVDFYIEPGIIDRFALAIEIDGHFHFKGDSVQLNRDLHVDRHCRDAGIHLLRIHYKTKIAYNDILADFRDKVNQAHGSQIIHCYVRP